MNSHRSKVLMISARSDVGGGPAHMHELTEGVASAVDVCAALPADGRFYLQFQSLLGAKKVFEIPRQKFKPGSFFELRRFCRQQEIRLIHSHGKGAGVYSRLLGLSLGVPVIHTLHGYHDGRYAPWLKLVYALWEKSASLLTARIICVSVSEAVIFKKKTKISGLKLNVIPNGTKVQATSLKPISKNKIFTVARFDYQKNLIEFLQVAELLSEYDFYVIGDGAERPALESFIADHKLCNVTLCGESHRVMQDIADADVYLSTARWEGLPLAVLEAASLGIPVVASDVVGNRDAVNEGVTGFLYPLGDTKAAAIAIRKAQGLDRAVVCDYHRLHFSSERMVNQTLQIYRQVLGC